MTVHASLKVWQVLDHLWRAPCACGESWTAETKPKANRLRNKHIREIAVARKLGRGTS